MRFILQLSSGTLSALLTLLGFRGAMEAVVLNDGMWLRALFADSAVLLSVVAPLAIAFGLVFAVFAMNMANQNEALRERVRARR